MVTFFGACRVGAHGDVRNIDVLVLHLHEAEVLLGLDLAARRKLRDRAGRRGLRRLPARVGVDLGVHDEDLDVLARGEDVVKPARMRRRSFALLRRATRRRRPEGRTSDRADVVGPAGAAKHPDRLAHEVVRNRLELLSLQHQIGWHDNYLDLSIVIKLETRSSFSNIDSPSTI